MHWWEQSSRKYALKTTSNHRGNLATLIIAISHCFESSPAPTRLSPIFHLTFLWDHIIAAQAEADRLLRERRDNLPRHLRHLTDAQLDVHPELQNYQRDAKTPSSSSTKTTKNDSSSSSSSSTSTDASAGAAGDHTDGFGRSESPPPLTAAQAAAAAQVAPESKPAPIINPFHFLQSFFLHKSRCFGCHCLAASYTASMDSLQSLSRIRLLFFEFPLFSSRDVYGAPSQTKSNCVERTTTACACVDLSGACMGASRVHSGSDSAQV